MSEMLLGDFLISLQVDAAVRRVNELHERNESAEMSERAARKEYMDIKLKFEGGLTGHQQ